MKKKFDIPILILIYNRPNLTKQLCLQIAKVKPTRIYIASDGPKNGEIDKDKVELSRFNAVTSITWDCEIKENFNQENLGCRIAVSEAINWFFDNEEMGIILEDDCMPSESFFYYCQQLLEYYKYDERIYSISGFNQQNIFNVENDYFFSKLGNCWGWASWRRCWKDYDVEIKDFKIFEKSDGFKNALGSSLGAIKKKMIFDGVLLNKSDSWALQWGYLRHKNNGLTCIPSRSLIKNIGFGSDATHTIFKDTFKVDNHEIDFPLKINNFVVPSEDYDNLMFKRPSIYERLLNLLFKN